MIFNIVLVPVSPKALNGLNPTLDYVCEAISACGHQVVVSHGQVHPGVINLIPDGYYTREGIDALMKQRDEQGLKLGLLTTELYMNQQIPYGLHGLYTGGDIARTSAILEQRLDALYYLAGKVDFIWSLLERSAKEFAQICAGPSLWFPYGKAAPVPREFRDYPKTIDVLFIGKNNEHRAAIIGHMLDRGLNVVAYGMGFPLGHLADCFLHSTLCRSKIMLNLTFTHFGMPDVDPRFSSCTRVQQALLRDICVVSEEIPFDNPYAPYTVHLPCHKLLDACKGILDSGQWNAMGEEFSARFAEEMDARVVCRPTIDMTVARYMN